MALDIKTTLSLTGGKIDTAAINKKIEEIIKNLGKINKISDIMKGKPGDFLKVNTKEVKDAKAALAKLAEEYKATVVIGQKGIKVTMPVPSKIVDAETKKPISAGTVSVETGWKDDVQKQEKLLDLKNRMIKAGQDEQTINNTIGRLEKAKGAELVKQLANQETILKRLGEKRAIEEKLKNLTLQLVQSGAKEAAVVKIITGLQKAKGAEFAKQYADAQRGIKMFKDEEGIRKQILALMEKHKGILDGIGAKEKEVSQAGRMRLADILKQAQAYEKIKLAKQAEANRSRELLGFSKELVAAEYKKEKIAEIILRLKKAEKGEYRSLLTEEKKALSLEIKRKNALAYITLQMKSHPGIARQLKKEFGDLSKLDPFRMLKAQQRVKEMQSIQSAGYRNRLELDRISNSLRRVGMVGVMAFGMMLREAMKFNLALVRLTQGYNLTNQEAVAFAGLAESTGISIDSLTKGIGNYFQKIITAGQGTSLVAERVREALMFAGLEAVKLGGRGMPAIEMLDKMRKVFQGLEEPQDRAYLGQMVFGGEFEKFLPLLQMTDKAFANIIGLFEDYADMLDKNVGQAMIDVNAQLVAMKFSFRILATTIATKLQPTFENLVKVLRGALKIFDKMPEGIKSITANMMLFVPIMATLLSTLGLSATGWRRLSEQWKKAIPVIKFLTKSVTLFGGAVTMAMGWWILLGAALVAISFKIWKIVKYNKALVQSYDILQKKIGDITSTSVAYAEQLKSTGKLTEMQTEKLDGYIKKIAELGVELEETESRTKAFWTNKRKAAETIKSTETSIDKTEAALKSYIQTIKQGSKAIAEIPFDLTKDFDVFASTVGSSSLLATEKVFIVKKTFDRLRDTIKKAGGDMKDVEEQYRNSMSAIVGTSESAIHQLRAALIKPLPALNMSKFGAAMEKIRTESKKTMDSLQADREVTTSSLKKQLADEEKSAKENAKVLENAKEGVKNAKEFITLTKEKIAALEKTDIKGSPLNDLFGLQEDQNEKLKQAKKTLAKQEKIYTDAIKDKGESTKEIGLLEERLSQVEKAGAEDRTLAKKREAELNLRMKEKFAKDEQKLLLKLNQNIDDIERKSLTKQLDALRKRQDNNLAEEKNYWKEMANISAKYGLTAINKAFLKADEDLLVHRKKTALGKISKQKTDAIDAAREKQEDAMFALNATFKGEDLKDLEGNRMYNTRKALIDKRYADSKLAAEKTSFMQAETTQEQFQTDSIKSVSRYYRDIIKNEQYTFSERQQLVREGFAAIGKLYEKGRMNADQYRNALLDIKSSQLELERAMALATPFDSLMNNWDKFIDRFGDTRDRLKKDVFDKMTSDFKSFFRGLIESPKDFLKNFIPSIEKMRGAIYAKMAERRAEAEISQRIEAGEEMTFAKQAGIGFKWAQIYNIAKLRNAGKDITKVMKEINKVIGNVSEKDIASVGNPLDSYGTISKKKIDDIAKYGKEKLSKMTGGLIIDEVMVKKVAGLTDKIKNVLADETIPVEEQRAIVRQKLVTANIPKYTDATQRVMQVVSDTGTPELKDKMQKITQVIESYYMPKKMDETGVMANVSFNILPGAIDMLKTTFKTLLPSLEVLVKPILKPNSLSVLPSLALDMGSVAGMPGQSAIQPATQVNNTEMSVNFHGITDTQSMVDLLKQEVLDAIDMRGFRK